MEQTMVAIVGLGARGFHTYAQYQKIFPERMHVTAIADIDPLKVKVASEDLNIAEERCFSSAEELLSQKKLADVLIIATQDHQHVRHALLGLRCGYDIILEKPIATTYEDCVAIRNEAERLHRRAAICHVLRYTAFYRTIKNIIDFGKIGEIMHIDAVENVAYWHYAHSFVRGNWNNADRSSPIILAKCCHDLDILNFLIGLKCERLSSFGSLDFFNDAHRPADAAAFCLACPRCDTCIYSAKNIYLADDAMQKRKWLCYVVSPEGTRASLEEALRTEAYGRCVFASDNDVVDHQVVAMQYERGVTATLTMSAFSEEMFRSIRVMGTLGEIEGDQRSNMIKVTVFGQEPELFNINKLATDLSGHGGGDNQMMTDFFRQIQLKTGDVSSSVNNSIESHAMAFAAEQSRVRGGEPVDLKLFEKTFCLKQCREESDEKETGKSRAYADSGSHCIVGGGVR